MAETLLEEEKARKLMTEANDDLRAAIVMFRADVTREKAMTALSENNFVVEKAIESL
jgi:N-acetylmuramic acid 6-phosphate (MurNAc-6-P) etherase